MKNSVGLSSYNGGIYIIADEPCVAGCFTWIRRVICWEKRNNYNYSTAVFTIQDTKPARKKDFLFLFK